VSHSTPSSVRLLIQQILRDLPFSMRQIAEEAGVSYDAVRSWATERRTPRTENLMQLADAIERRSHEMQALAEALREAALKE
jgi:predicted transcriptional regulator